MTVLCFYRIFRKCPNFFENQVTNFCDIFVCNIKHTTAVPVCTYPIVLSYEICYNGVFVMLDFCLRRGCFLQCDPYSFSQSLLETPTVHSRHLQITSLDSTGRPTLTICIRCLVICGLFLWVWKYFIQCNTTPPSWIVNNVKVSYILGNCFWCLHHYFFSTCTPGCLPLRHTHWLPTSCAVIDGG